MTIEELAAKNCHSYDKFGQFSFNLDELRALITEAVGIVAGEPVAYEERTLNGATFLTYDTPESEPIKPLHAIDMGRLK